VYVRHLSLADFRSWHTAEVGFEPGPNVLLGANGQGKTNLVEAVGYLATGTSHRSATDAPLIRSGAEQAALRAAVVSAGRELRLELEIRPGRTNQARISGSPVRLRDAVGVLRAVLFAPEDLAIVRGDPAERRRFIDELATARTPRIAGARSDYERVLKQRAALLKSAAAARHRADLSTLDIWDAHLARHGAQLLAARLATLAALAPPAAAAYAQVAPTSEPLVLEYSSTLGSSLQPDPAALEAALLEELARVRPAELERGVNLVGPHRDDLLISLGALPVRGYASHGESWSTALALRLGSFELLREEAAGMSGGEPVLVLDDVFAELDVGRREQLAGTAAKAEQVLVTAAVADDVPGELVGARFEVTAGMVRRV
jgi:DNA replication and repair protein RecF